MHLSNYNLFSFLVPEGEALGNQTCSSHWNPASSVPLVPPPCTPSRTGALRGYVAILKTVGAHTLPYHSPQNASLICPSVCDPFLSVETPQVQSLGHVQRHT